jgi:transcription elongation GreA/GreB family factor/very-short-patch-repair endonuclease
LGPRSNSHLRAVDELPDVLFFKLNNEQPMVLIPLPAIEEDPRDEKSDIFRETLINARLIDQDYNAEMESIDKDSDGYLEQSRRIERSLKDKVRIQLGLPPRVDKSEMNLNQHAKNNGIAPSYELPQAADENGDGRHQDNNIQTLLLPDDLERKLNAVLSKSRTWVQETGMNVLQTAFGFLEWSEESQTETSFAPLILLPVEIDRARTPQGNKFSIVGSGDGPDLNAVLSEKLRIDFGIELPNFTGSSIESYLADVSKVLPKRKNWRIRRQVALGVFPSARMAMYYDLDTKQAGFPASEIVDSLLAGSDSAGSSPFADEYNVDEPDIERKVPWLVTDADSSQFSALADIGDGKNLAVEGPPGTGKSQTIVNAIAGALGNGKRVLFVAEKLAALNVVKSRLEAIGLGEFLLPLQAEKSTREQVIDSIRARLEMRDVRAVKDYEERVSEFRRVRAELSDYIDLMTTEFSDSGKTIHEILGKSILSSSLLNGVSAAVLDRCTLRPDFQTATGFAALVATASQIEKAHAEKAGSQPTWNDTRLTSPDPFTIEEACELAGRAAVLWEQVIAGRRKLHDFGLDGSESAQLLRSLAHYLERASAEAEGHALELIRNLLDPVARRSLTDFLSRCAAVEQSSNEVSTRFIAPLSGEIVAKVEVIETVVARCGLTTIDPKELAEQLSARRKTAQTARTISTALTPLVRACDAAKEWQFDDLSRAHDAFESAGRDALILRNERLALSDAPYHLRSLCEEGRDLQRSRQVLSERLVLASELPMNALTDAASVLRGAGWFSFLSRQYRTAKRTAQSVSRGKPRAVDEALKNLDDLVTFRKNCESYFERAKGSGLFGSFYRGLDTKFEQFERLADYYNAISKTFRDPSHATLRDFLRNAPLAQLELLPAIPQINAQISYSTLTERVRTADEDVARLEGAIEELAKIGDVFALPNPTIEEIRQLRGGLKNILKWRAELDESVPIRALLQSSFNGSRTEPSKFTEVIAWADAATDVAESLDKILARKHPNEAAVFIQTLISQVETFESTITQLSDTAKIDISKLLAGEADKLLAWLRTAQADSAGLFAHAVFATSMVDAEPSGIAPLVEDRLKGGSLVLLSRQVESLAIRKLAKAVYAKHGKTLTKFRGSKLDELRSALAKKDREIIEFSRRQLRAKIKAAARPPGGVGSGKKSSWTNMALIENEISKKQRFISVRELTQRAGRALSELKPCWMMSPLAVAQYVPKGVLEFDLCIIDEASQMPPESAIGALLRSKQAIVVGDTNQLPPSSFFKTLIDDEDADEDEAVLNESVLEMANGAFRPARRLRWHYRSRHSGLIKFSNRLVYDDRLIVFPSATESMASMGVEYRKVHGHYKAGTNPTEAKVVVEAIIDFMRTDPDRSLGVVTLNQKQRDLIKEEFDHAITNNRGVQKYIENWEERNDGLEEFFIKNLENVQGDERDVIFIGTVYGAERDGSRVMQRFGPINGLAGKRRLNVLFTRAKQKIVTFSSMTAADIESDELRNPGTYMLKRWLEYCASGVLDAGEETRREPDSDFEAFVIEQIRSMGCEPIPQVGVAGYFVDIGIRHPEWPHGFILGVECDGAAYHSAKSARDRDRLRQEILEGLGWKLHRIWSTDWFTDSRKEGERLRQVIANRLTELKLQEHQYICVPLNAVPQAKKETRIADLFDDDVAPSARAIQLKEPPKDETRVEVGDTVRVRYLTDDQKTIVITISDSHSDAARGIIHRQMPIASALLGAEEGEEVEVLVGSYIRPAVVEKIQKNKDVS